MHTSPIRTITLGIADPHPLTPTIIQHASTILQKATTRYTEAGYEIQTVRLSTRPIFDDLADWSSTQLLTYTQQLQHMLDNAGLTFCSLGPAQASQPDFLLERIALIPDILASTSALNATVQIATQEHGLRPQAALPTAQVITRLAHETEEGFGNFRFAMLSCVTPGSPFFPAAYHHGPASLSIGLQGANIISQALRPHAQGEATPIDLTQISELVKIALIDYTTPIVTLAQTLARENNLAFGGIDLSPAPMGEDSIVSALELCGYGKIGSPGTVAVAAAITHALKHMELLTCGYCGLMLPVLEDAALGRRWEEGYLNVHQLLLYSAVCGTGLDTLPLP